MYCIFQLYISISSEYIFNNYYYLDTLYLVIIDKNLVIKKEICKRKFNVKHRECLSDHLSQRLMIKCLTIIQIELEFGNVGF